MKSKVSKSRHDAQESADIPEQMWIEIIKDVSCRAGADRIRDGCDETCNRHITSAHFLGSEACRDYLTGGEVEHLAETHNRRCDHKQQESTDNTIQEHSHREDTCADHHHQERRAMADHAADPELE